VWFSIHWFLFVEIKSDDRSSQPTGFGGSHPFECARYNRRPSFSGYSTQQEVFECSNWLTDASTALDSHEPVSRLRFKNIRSSSRRNEPTDFVGPVFRNHIVTKWWVKILSHNIHPASRDLNCGPPRYEVGVPCDVRYLSHEITSANFLGRFYICGVFFSALCCSHFLLIVRVTFSPSDNSVCFYNEEEAGIWTKEITNESSLTFLLLYALQAVIMADTSSVWNDWLFVLEAELSL
jgi:hypothetical protein